MKLTAKKCGYTLAIPGIALACSLVLSGCDSSPDTDTGTPTNTDTTTQPHNDNSSFNRVSKDQAFIHTIRDSAELPYTLTSAPDSSFISLAHTTCDAFDRGVTVSDLSTMFTEAGFDTYQTGFFLGASTAAYCPEYKDVVTQ